MKPQWINPDTFSFQETNEKRRVFLFKRSLFDVNFHDCRFQDSEGNVWGPNEPKTTNDGGSVPWPVCVLLPRREYIRPYSLHDDAYKHHGLILCPESGEPRFVELTRKQCDVILEESIEASPNDDALDSEAVYAGVRLGGRSPWKNHGV